MKFELRRIDPVRAANIAALIYALFLVGLSAIVIPCIFAYARSQGIELESLRISLVGIMGWVILGPAIGWFFGFFGCVAYNLVSGWTGGLSVEGSALFPLVDSIREGLRERAAARNSSEITPP